MTDNPNYGQDLKSIKFMVSDDDHARLLIRLRHNKVNVAQFFRAVIMEHKILSRKRFTKSLKLRKKGQEVLEDYGLLDDAEKQEIFDLISKEFPDL